MKSAHKKKTKSSGVQKVCEVNVRLKMPCVFEVDDYHEFGYLEDYMQKLFPYNKVIVEEILGHPDGEAFYKGIAYLAGQEREYEALKAELEEAYAGED